MSESTKEEGELSDEEENGRSYSRGHNLNISNVRHLDWVRERQTLLPNKFHLPSPSELNFRVARPYQEKNMGYKRFPPRAVFRSTSTNANRNPNRNYHAPGPNGPARSRTKPAAVYSIL